MKETRIKKIFDKLNESGTYITSDELSQLLNVSSKTIRNEIKDIDTIFKKNGGHVESRAGYGFRFEVTDMDLFREFIANKWHEYAFIDETLSFKENRIHYLLKTMLFSKDYIRVSDLCDQMQISKSQISSDLQQLRQKIEPFQLKLDVRPHHGMKIVGPEINLRLCIASLLFNSNENIEEEDEFETTWVMNEIRESVLTVFNNHQYETSELVFRNLVTHLFVAIERIKMDEPIEMDPSHLEELRSSSEYAIADDIIQQLEKLYGHKFPEDEKGYVTMHLSGKRVFGQSEDGNNVVSAEIDNLVVRMIDKIKTSMDIDLSSDLDLRVALGLHCVPLIKRINYKLTMKNPLLEDIKKHKQAFMVASVAAEVIDKQYHVRLSEDEIAYFALHFYVGIERLKMEINRKKVLLVCSTGHGTAKLLQYRFKQEFGSYLEDIQTKDALSIGRLDLSKFDLIVSTVPLNVKCNTPIIYVTTLLNDQDIKTIRHRFNTDESSIAEYFDRKLFLKDIVANTKEEIIYFMAKKISDLYGFDEGFYESILRREQAAPTEFGNLIAIPHPDRAFSKNTIVSVSILKKPILWKEKMVQLVFMLSYGDQENDNLDEFFARSAQFLTSAADINDAIQAKDYDQFIRIIDKN